MVIDSFSGEYEFLSNFSPSPIVCDGIIVPTVEHAYQAYKTTIWQERAVIMTAGTPGKAKRLGQECKKRAMWDGIKIDVMRGLLLQKFSALDMREKLIATCSDPLVEGNHWDDVFWGVCGGEGENNLGKLLMEIRSLIQGFKPRVHS